MDSVFTLQNAVQNGDYSVYDITPQELETACKSLVNEAITELRQSGNSYLSEYQINKDAIRCAFSEHSEHLCSKLSLILNRLALIDNMYSTQMRMRPYGIGELAEAISLFGADSQLKGLFAAFLVDHDIAHFDYLKAKMKFYRDGKGNTSSNLFEEGFGVESHNASNKRAWSLITKYAYFLTDSNFPIYDSLVKGMIPIFWKLCILGTTLPNYEKSIVDYIVVIDRLRAALGVLSYDEFDFLLWSVGKILKGNLSLILSMEDYLLVPKGFNIKTINLSSLSFLSNNKALKTLFQLAQFISNCK